ncbi:MAG: DUF427 domain-containing protein [Vicinamibacterales bacterium]
MANTDPAPHGWTHIGRRRPPFAVVPEPGQESVWDYPRPPVVVPDDRLVTVALGDSTIVETRRALRVLETASPPTFYLPLSDVVTGRFEPGGEASWCEWKGEARYWSLVVEGRRVDEVAWSYPTPRPGFAMLRDRFAVYGGRLACFVGGERVRPQAGGFYGGWITSEVVGPFKGEPGTAGW